MLILRYHFLDLKPNVNSVFSVLQSAFHFRKVRFKTISLTLSNKYYESSQNNVQKTQVN